jgi:nitrogen-specific signal transduction histidine kinase
MRGITEDELMAFFAKARSRNAPMAKLAGLEALRANVMLADNDLNITYVNTTALALMKEAEADLKKELPRFDVTP